MLYSKRRTSPSKPEVSFRDIERRLGFPRDYLDFTAWYLRTKNFITRSDNAEFAITAEGVDFVENQRTTAPVLEKLLTVGDTLTIPDDPSEFDRKPVHGPYKA
jgi:hypothetical protein